MFCGAYPVSTKRGIKAAFALVVVTITLGFDAASTRANQAEGVPSKSSNISTLWPGSLDWLWATKNHSKVRPRHYEVFAGADGAKTVWLLYSGATLAPFGDIHDQGWRLRASGGYGQYTYTSRKTSRPFNEQSHRAATHYQDALVGYLARLDPLIAKAFIGVAQIDHQILPYDGLNVVQGPDFGVKGVIELWLNIGKNGWASLDLSWSQAHNTRTARARIAHRFENGLSVGLESAINVDAQAEFKLTKEAAAHRNTAMDFARVGTFVRADWYGGEISASSGLLGDFTNEKTPYATINWIKQF